MSQGMQDHLRLDLTDLTELSLGIGSGDGGRNDNIITGQPVDGAGNAVLLGGLESINDTENLSSVAAGRGGVGHDQTDLLGGVDDEDGADGQSHTLGVNVGGVLVVNHVVQVGDLALGVGDDGELELGAGDLIDVLDPTVVRFNVVGTQTDELDTTRGELGLKLGEGTELGGADGSEIIGVGEEDGPLVADEVVEVDGTVGGLGVEVRGSRAQTEAVGWSAIGPGSLELYRRGVYIRSTLFSHCDNRMKDWYPDCFEKGYERRKFRRGE